MIITALSVIMSISCCLLCSTSQVSKVAAKGLWVAAGCGVASCIGTLVFADAIVNCESAAQLNASDQSAEASPDTAGTSAWCSLSVHASSS